MEIRIEIIDGKEVKVKVYKPRLPRKKLTAKCGISAHPSRKQIERRRAEKKKNQLTTKQLKAKARQMLDDIIREEALNGPDHNLASDIKKLKGKRK